MDESIPGTKMIAYLNFNNNTLGTSLYTELTKIIKFKKKLNKPNTKQIKYEQTLQFYCTCK